MANGEIKTIQKADIVSGTVTAYTKLKNVTVDGTKYEYSKNYTKAVTDSDMKYDLNEDYTLVLDTNGYVVYSDASDGTNDYVYVDNAAWTSGAKNNLEADAYFIDGTNKVIVVDNDDESPWKDNETDKDGSHYGYWFSFDEKSNGKYELTEAKGEQHGTASEINRSQLVAALLFSLAKRMFVLIMPLFL